MFQHKQSLLIGAVALAAAVAMVPQDAHAWQARRLFYPIDIVERDIAPTKMPALDGAARRIKVDDTRASGSRRAPATAAVRRVTAAQ